MEFISYKEIKGFDSLYLPVIEFDQEIYPLTPLSIILGYSTPHSILNIIPEEYRIDIQSLYSFYCLYLDQFSTYLPQSKQQFTRSLSAFKPLNFTTKEGIVHILSRNTFTLPKIKMAIAESLGIPTLAPPHKESSFYETLSSLLEGTGVTVKRHVRILDYIVDMEITGLNPPIVVEYDENNHASYDKDKEMLRESRLRASGYDILRIDDSEQPIQSASKIFRQIVHRFSAKMVL